MNCLRAVLLNVIFESVMAINNSIWRDLQFVTLLTIHYLRFPLPPTILSIPHPFPLTLLDDDRLVQSLRSSATDQVILPSPDRPVFLTIAYIAQLYTT